MQKSENVKNSRCTILVCNPRYPLKLTPGSEQVYLETQWGAQGAHWDGKGAGGRRKICSLAAEAGTRQDRICTARRQGSWQKEGKQNHSKPKRFYMRGSCRLERLWEILPNPNNEKARPGDMKRGRERGISGGAHCASWRQHQFGAWAERELLRGSCGRMWGGRVESNAFPGRSWLQRIHRD